MRRSRGWTAVVVLLLHSVGCWAPAQRGSGASAARDGTSVEPPRPSEPEPAPPAEPVVEGAREPAEAQPLADGVGVPVPGLERGIPAVEGRYLPGGLDRAMAPPPSLDALVARSSAELEAARVTLDRDVDFGRFVVVAPFLRAGPSGEVPAVLEALEATEATSPLRIHRSTASRVEVVFEDPCAICGGASITALHAMDCRTSFVPRAFLVPRPTDLLVVAQRSGACNPALP